MLNDAQNRKLIGKLKRALEVFEPYVFTKIAQLPYTMYETADRLETVPDATLAAVPETRPTGKTWGGEGRYCWFLTQYTPPNELAGQPLYLYPELGGYEAMLWVNGEPYGTFATKIVVTRHGNHYCDCFTRAAVPGTPVQLAIEFYAGHYVIGEQPFEERPHRDFRFTADKISVCTNIQYYLRFWLGICRTSLAVSALRIMRYCPSFPKTGHAATPAACPALSQIPNYSFLIFPRRAFIPTANS